jgi:hypothetical protein
MPSVIDIDRLSSISVQPGSNVVVGLTTQRTSGFNWFLVSISSPFVQLVGSSEGDYIPDHSHKYGENGQQQFTLAINESCQVGSQVNCTFQQKDLGGDVNQIHYLALQFAYSFE